MLPDDLKYPIMTNLLAADVLKILPTNYKKGTKGYSSVTTHLDTREDRMVTKA